jgi:hypothetical protein
LATFRNHYIDIMSSTTNTPGGKVTGAGEVDMETINNVVTATSKAVFGDGSDKKEPVSGAAGDVSKGEPYDAGNLGMSSPSCGKSADSTA